MDGKGKIVVDYPGVGYITKELRRATGVYRFITLIANQGNEGSSTVLPFKVTFAFLSNAPQCC